MSADLSSLFYSVTAVLSKVVDKQSSNSTSDYVLVACGPYQPLWPCIVSVYCSSLIGRSLLHSSLSWLSIHSREPVSSVSTVNGKGNAMALCLWQWICTLRTCLFESLFVSGKGLGQSCSIENELAMYWSCGLPIAVKRIVV